VFILSCSHPVSELTHLQPCIDSIFPPLDSVSAEPDVDISEPEPIATQPELTPISKSKKAQARCANALIDPCTPAFAMATATVRPYLQTISSLAIASAPSPPPVFELPLRPQLLA
jgi:hypothetical protein